MITRITGRLCALDGHSAEIDPGAGLTYQVLLPAFLADRLTERIGETVALAALEYLEPVGGGTSFVPRILGFETPDQRRFLELLTTCKGVSARRALRIMAAPHAEIAAMIASHDAKALQRLPEIGKRLAETIIAELGAKIGPFVIEASAASAGPRRGSQLAGSWAESAAALVSLGQNPAEAQRLIEDVKARSPELDDAEAIVAAALGRV